MPKGNIVKCPECGKTYKQVKNEDVYCSGRFSPTAVPHKKERLMT